MGTDKRDRRPYAYELGKHTSHDRVETGNLEPWFIYPMLLVTDTVLDIGITRGAGFTSAAFEIKEACAREKDQIMHRRKQ